MAHILIIEDDTPLQKIYGEVLRKEGYEVTIASTGQEGLTAIAKDHVNLVLLDIMLPGGMNGFDVLTKVKMDEKMHEVPVIIMTNLDSERKTGLEMGAIDYFFKPNMDVATLVQKIKQHLPIQSSPAA